MTVNLRSLRRLVAISNYRGNHSEAKVPYDCRTTAPRGRGGAGMVLLHNTGDLYLFVDVLREILTGIQWEGVALSL